MKKILTFLVSFLLMFVCIFKVDAAQVLEQECSYVSNDLHVIIKIYSGSRNGLPVAYAKIYKFGSETWKNGKEVTGFLNAIKIPVENYGEDFTKDKKTIKKYEDGKNYTCPKHILVEDDTYYSAFVSNKKSDLTTFANAVFSGTNRKYYAEYSDTSTEIDDIDKVCAYYFEDANGKGYTSQVEIKDDGTMYMKSGAQFYGTTTVGDKKIENYTEFGYKGDCPTYFMVAMDGAKFKGYVSANKSDLESIASTNKWGLTFKVGDNNMNKAIIKTLKGHGTGAEVEKMPPCKYSDIENCSGCEIEIQFTDNVDALKEGDSVVVSSKVISGDISEIDLAGLGWTDKGGQYSNISFSQELRSKICPPGLKFSYNTSSKKVTIYTDVHTQNQDINSGNNSGASAPDFEFNEDPMTCEELLGPNLTKVVKAALTLVRIGASIATIVIGMLNFLPALTKGDQGEFNKAVKKCIWLVVVLMLIILIPVLLRTIGNLFNWDISCFV